MITTLFAALALTIASASAEEIEISYDFVDDGRAEVVGCIVDIPLVDFPEEMTEETIKAWISDPMRRQQFDAVRTQVEKCQALNDELYDFGLVLEEGLEYQLGLCEQGEISETDCGWLQWRDHKVGRTMMGIMNANLMLFELKSNMLLMEVGGIMYFELHEESSD
jgi:hypothetical protein